MMAFDPDEYLAQDNKFDPDAYLASGQPVQEKKASKGFSWTDVIAPVVAPLEVGAQMGSSMVGQILGGWAGLLNGGDADVVRRVQNQVTYQPKTELGQGLSKVVSYPFEKGMEMTKAAGGAIGEKIGGEQGRIAGEAIGEQVIPVAGTLAGGYSMLKGARANSAASQQALIDKSIQDAARIEAAKLAVDKYGLSLDPIVSNPTKLNSLRATAVGQEYLNSLVRKTNEPKIVNILKEDVGIPKDVSLTSSTVFDNALSEAGKAKSKIQAIPSMVDDGTTLNALDSLRPDKLIGAKPQTKRVNALVDDARSLVSSEVSGAKLIKEIENLRSMARSLYKNQNLKPKDRAVADAYMKIANTFESMIDSNLTKLGMDDLLAEFKAGRQQMAKIYTLKDATDLNTGLVDPSVLAKITSSDNALTGAFADLGKIAGNFPESLGVKKGAPGGLKEFTQTHAVRTGPAGLVGYGVGTLFNTPLLGAAVGAGLGEIGSIMYGKRLATNPAVQKAISVPIDYRPMLGQSTIQAANLPQAKRELSLAPLESLPQPKQINPPLTRGMLSLADDSQQMKNIGIQIPSVEYTLQPKIGPLYGTINKESGIRVVPKESYPPNLGMPAMDINAPAGRGMLSLADDFKSTSTNTVDSIPFKLRQEVLQDPQITSAINSFRHEASQLEQIANNAISKTVRDNATRKLSALQDEFLAGMKMLGIRNEKEAIGLVKLYESGNVPRLPIEKVKGLK